MKKGLCHVPLLGIPAYASMECAGICVLGLFCADHLFFCNEWSLATSMRFGTSLFKGVRAFVLPPKDEGSRLPI